eukprot:CAMPEP_0169111254 /NCGR_PEP_ID=MMETSP1015-20121227/26963_1 /TAXON_ID=342587 /ORGANISM="Karlodinium micrum, Strain CCMP2283" /LENGTH=196 /DNA_ID=CAMNT_0009173131 /DNA_START=61 /DNA_END=654 /DNA_ORIENTATION=+
MKRFLCLLALKYNSCHAIASNSQTMSSDLMSTQLFSDDVDANPQNALATLLLAANHPIGRRTFASTHLNEEAATRRTVVQMRRRDKEKEGMLYLDGVVVQAGRGGVFKVSIPDTGAEVNARPCGTLLKNRIKILVGDKVGCEFSPYDLSKCRIVKRTIEGYNPFGAAAGAAADDDDEDEEEEDDEEESDNFDEEDD